MHDEEITEVEQKLAKMLIEKHAGDIVAAGLRQLARRPVDKFVRRPLDRFAKWWGGRPRPKTAADVMADAVRETVGSVGAAPLPIV